VLPDKLAPWQWGREAVEQADAADEGRLEASGSIMVGTVTADQGKVVRPSQLIRRVLRALEGRVARPGEAKVSW